MRASSRYLALVLLLLSPSILSAQSTMPRYEVGAPISIGETLSIESTIFHDHRTILISPPARYSEDRNDRYPVIYFTDGSGARLRTIRGVVSFLADIGKMPDAILVGIVHTNRDRELTPYDPQQVDPDGYKRDIPNCGGADQLLQFINEELIPVVEAQYRTRPSRIFVGHSYGGLLGVYSIYKYPEMFEANIAIDPSIWWNAGAYVDSLGRLLEGHPDFQYSLFASKTKSDDKYALPFDKLRHYIDSYASSKFRYDYLEMPAAESHQSSVLPALYYGLMTIYSEFPIPTSYTLADIKARNARSILGATYRVAEAKLNGYGYYRLGKMDYDEAIAAFEYCISLYPDSWNAYDSAAEACVAAGQKAKAIAYLEKALLLNPDNSNGRRILDELKNGN